MDPDLVSKIKRDAVRKILEFSGDLIQEQVWWEVYLDHMTSRKKRLAWIRLKDSLLQASTPFEEELHSQLSHMRRLVEISGKESFLREYVFFLVQLILHLPERDLVKLQDFILPHLDRIEEGLPHALTWEDWTSWWALEDTGESLWDWLSHWEERSSAYAVDREVQGMSP